MRKFIRRLGLSIAVVAASAVIFVPQVASAATYIYRPSLVTNVNGVAFTPSGVYNSFSPNGLWLAGTSNGQAAIYRLTTRTVILLGDVVGADLGSSPYSEAVDVNDRGDVVGIRDVGSGRVRIREGWFLPAGATRVQSFGFYAWPNAMNNVGQVVGTDVAGAGAFLWDRAEGVKNYLPFTPTGHKWYTSAINSAGLISGLTTEGESVVYDSAAEKFIDVPTTKPFSSAQDVNENGVVVGAQYEDLGESTPGRAYTFDVPTRKFTRRPGLYHYTNLTISKTGIVVGTVIKTGQPVVINDCAGTPFTALGLSTDAKLGGAVGADAKGAIWGFYGDRLVEGYRTVRWLRTPACGT